MDKSVHYVVVYNKEGQYSIWPAYRDVPLGWSAEGKSGSKEECLSRISELWTDMKPQVIDGHDPLA